MNKRQRKRLQLLHKLGERLSSGVADEDLHRLSFEQLQYVNHRLGMPCYVEACPGSGKTEVVGMKAAYEFAGWQDRFAGIAILTFTRNACAQIRGRAAQYAGGVAARHSHFIGTIDSWLHNYLLQPFAHAIVGYAGKDGDMSVKVIENQSKAGFLKSYEVRVRGAPRRRICANEYYKRHDGELEGIIRTSIVSFDKVRLRSTKDSFLRDGFVTYQDAESICYEVLRQYPRIGQLLAQRFPYIIVDECQDLSDCQLHVFCELMNAGIVLQFVGDLNQAIYEFRKVDPQRVAKFVDEQGFQRKTLTRNYRSNQAIVDVCTGLMRSSQRIQGREVAECDTPCILWQYADETFGCLPKCFENLVARLGLDSRECCIVARGTILLDRLHPQKKKRTMPVELFAAALNCWHLRSRSTIDIDVALHSLGKSLSLLAYSGRGHHQKQYCPDDVDPVRWRIFLAEVLDKTVDLYPFADDLSWSQWTKELKGYLEGMWSSLPVKGKGWGQIKNRIRAPSNRGKIGVAQDFCIVGPASSLRITTIHDVKGETFDALLLISAKNKQSRGGHFEQWLHPQPGKEEYRRFAYVACSRPQHLLVIATPRLSEEQLQEFKKLGLEPQDMS